MHTPELNSLGAGTVLLKVKVQVQRLSKDLVKAQMEQNHHSRFPMRLHIQNWARRELWQGAMMADTMAELRQGRVGYFAADCKALQACMVHIGNRLQSTAGKLEAHSQIQVRQAAACDQDGHSCSHSSCADMSN